MARASTSSWFATATASAAVAPLLEAGGAVGPFGVRLLVGIGQENADYGGFLVADGRGDAVALVLDHLREVYRGSTVVNLTRVPRDSLLGQALAQPHTGRAWEVATRESDTYPRLEFGLLDDPTGYVHERDVKNDSRRALRRLREQHDVEFEYDCGVGDETLRRMFEVYDRRWADRDGEPSGLFASSRGRAFLGSAVGALHERGAVRVSALRCDDEMVAVRLGFESEGWYLGYMEAFDPAFRRFGPGQILVVCILEELIGRGLHGFDFIRGEGFHKSKWANSGREVDYTLLSRGGRRGEFDRRLAWNVMRLRNRRNA